MNSNHGQRKLAELILWLSDSFIHQKNVINYLWRLHASIFLMENTRTLMVSENLTDATFCKTSKGVSSTEIVSEIDYLLKSKSAEIGFRDFLGRPKQFLQPLRPADLKVFDASEQYTIKKVADQLSIFNCFSLETVLVEAVDSMELSECDDSVLSMNSGHELDLESKERFQ